MNAVAFQGEPGAFSEEAAIRCFGHDVPVLPQRTFKDVVDAVLQGYAERGVLPLENSLIGKVNAAHEAAAVRGIKIERELWLPIEHCLMTRSEIAFDDLRRALSHPAALGQCKNFFAQNPHIEAVSWYDTAGAAKHVAVSPSLDVAAIASRRAAECYALTIVRENIQDSEDNRTRFVIVGRERNGT